MNIIAMYPLGLYILQDYHYKRKTTKHRYIHPSTFKSFLEHNNYPVFVV